MEYLQYKEVIDMADLERLVEVLNLIINGIPSILTYHVITKISHRVLNLIINGIPSIQLFNETIGDILEF